MFAIALGRCPLAGRSRWGNVDVTIVSDMVRQPHQEFLHVFDTVVVDTLVVRSFISFAMFRCHSMYNVAGHQKKHRLAKEKQGEHRRTFVPLCALFIKA